MGTPLKSIRKKCLNCSGFSSPEVKSCTFNECPLYPLHLGKRVKGVRPVKAIRLYCLECVKKNPNEIKLCPGDDCDIFRYRFGKNPSRRGIMPKKPFEGSKPHSNGGLAPEKGIVEVFSPLENDLKGQKNGLFAVVR